ncbi:GNAT family N-acetyltransferase [Thalassomonas viridans]|uniref:GNAT family N-acetyltransferase n=1 Tax=Thalassomonas viridans TaxID=137584 RepID=A0AAE9Z9K7_9GAMM|nr:GNAT family N-acetyltransferase [Thalassomonas viridans]WDE08634.1 GNAT family N-acetyltransferase [Thalassomonas viridans]
MLKSLRHINIDGPLKTTKVIKESNRAKYYIYDLQQNQHALFELTRICQKLRSKSGFQDLPDIPEYFLQMLSSCGAHIILAEINDALAGLLIFNKINVKNKKITFISYCSVIKDFQNLGIAKKLQIQALKFSRPDIAMGKTPNPLMFYLSTNGGRKLGRFYPDLTSPIPEEIRHYASQTLTKMLKTGSNLTNDFIIKNSFSKALGDSCVRKWAPENQAQGKRINEHFRQLENTDAQLVILVLSRTGKLKLFIRTLFPL